MMSVCTRRSTRVTIEPSLQMLGQTTIDREQLSRYISDSRAREPYGDRPHICCNAGTLDDGKTQGAIGLLVGSVEAVAHPLHPSQCDAVDGDSMGSDLLGQGSDQGVHGTVSRSIDARVG